MTETTRTQTEEPATTAAVVQLSNAPQSRGRPWVKGQSGNPRGRPLRTYSTSERIRATVGEDLDEIIAVVRRKALAGDMQAARLLLGLAIPPLKPIEIPIPMAPVTGSLPEQGAQIIAAMTSGQLTPAQCASLLMGLGAHARAVEIDAITNRLKTIEQALEHQNGQTP